MRRLLSATAVLGFIALQAPLPAQAGQQDFTLVNRTGYQIDEVYVSRTSSNSWGRDVMGRGTLDDGNSVDISINAPESVCSWDMQVKYNDGDTARWNHLNLCNIEKVTLYWDRRRQVTRAVTE